MAIRKGTVRREARDAFRRVLLAMVRSISDTVILFFNHLTVIAGGVLIVLIHGWRNDVVASDGGAGIPMLDRALRVGEWSLIITIAGPAVQLVTDLAERIAVAVVRIRVAWRTGTRAPGGQDEGGTGA